MRNAMPSKILHTYLAKREPKMVSYLGIKGSPTFTVSEN
jgi:hypothetical protein